MPSPRRRLPAVPAALAMMAAVAYVTPRRAFTAAPAAAAARHARSPLGALGSTSRRIGPLPQRAGERGLAGPGALLLAGCAAAARHSRQRVAAACLAGWVEESDSALPKEKTVENLRKFSNQYAKVTDTVFCADKAVSAVVLSGLAHHKETLGAPLCPCRHYEDKEAEAKAGYWNCPCLPMRERHECHCMLFLERDDEFASQGCQQLELDEILKLSSP